MIGKALVLALCCVSVLFGETSAELFYDKKAQLSESEKKDGISLLLKNYQWSNMWKELTFKNHIVICKHKGKNAAKRGMIGIEATAIEPLYLVDMTTEANEMKSIGLHLGSPRPDKTGDATDSGGTYIHVFKFPLFYTLFRENTDGMEFWHTSIPIRTLPT